MGRYRVNKDMLDQGLTMNLMLNTIQWTYQTHVAPELDMDSALLI